MKPVARVASALTLVSLLAAGGCHQSSPAATLSTVQQDTTAAQPASLAPGRPQVTTEGLPKTVDGRLVLAIVPATPDNTLQYEVAIGACMLKECPILISLLESGKVLDQTHARWASTTRQPMREDITLGWGVGDPAGPPDGMRAWMTGEEEDYVGTAVRGVALSPGMHGLLIDQRTGFEHLKRQHELFVHQNRRLQRAWSATEGAGPAWTSTATASAKDGREAVVFFEGFRYPLPDEADTLKVVWLQWDDARQMVVPQPGATSIDAAVIRGFETIGAARAAKIRVARLPRRLLGSPVNASGHEREGRLRARDAFPRSRTSAGLRGLCDGQETGNGPLDAELSGTHG
jgi:hypothetical protein